MKNWSRLQWLTHILCWLPLMVLTAAYFTNNLTINPIQAATQRSGDIAILILLASLTMTPLHILFNLPQLLKLRRPLGLYAFFYAALHMLTYTGWDYQFDFNLIYASIADKPYILIGLAAISLLTPLALTSHRWWQKTLGKIWKRLHQLVYLTAVLAVVHLAMAVKGDFLRLQGDIWKPLAATVVLAVLLIVRIPPLRRALSARHRRRRVVKITPQPTAKANPPGLESLNPQKQTETSNH
ncbi:predicted membrane protein [Bellilinea caldifistulae]|uniref:sulfite oxidase heme-binding subunit YedZ n=1 Tax=Bellilinea caldifistulae TaxID=360411 RepID=UPI00078133D7|nr:protein-methionine-sulfoxide reductase heme-binding subunit MsrQ [Bellilinea caldifistulae]GAP09867.1 predicted membrane protein [Bellilinea caldifistulae]